MISSDSFSLSQSSNEESLFGVFPHPSKQTRWGAKTYGKCAWIGARRSGQGGVPLSFYPSPFLSDQLLLHSLNPHPIFSHFYPFYASCLLCFLHSLDLICLTLLCSNPPLYPIAGCWVHFAAVLHPPIEKNTTGRALIGWELDPRGKMVTIMVEFNKFFSSISSLHFILDFYSWFFWGQHSI